MPMPLWVRFPPLRHDARALLTERLPDFLGTYGMTPFHAEPITREDDEIGVLDGQGLTSDDLSPLLALRDGHLGVSLAYHVRSVRRYFSFLVLDQPLPATLCLEIPREILAEDSDRFGKAGWLVGFLSKLANTLGCDCVLSTRNDGESGIIAPLDVHEVLGRVEAGTLFDSVTPVILVVRDTLVDATELASLVESQRDAGFRLEHDGGCHVLWSLKGAAYGG